MLIFIFRRSLQFFQVMQKLRLIDFDRPADMDLLVGRLLHALFLHEHLFIELLSGTKAGELDLNILAHAVAGKSDEVFRQIQDFHGFTHIEDKNLAALCVGSGLQDKRDRLRDRHEIPDNIRIGDRDRSARRNLFSEQRYDRTVASEYVAEPDSDEFGIRVMAVHRLNDHLADAF